MPKVLDKNGHELTVGAEVRLAGYGHMPPGPVSEPGTIRQFTVGTDTHEPGVEVRWPDGDTTCFDWYPLDQADACPDLLLIDSPTEGKEG